MFLSVSLNFWIITCFAVCAAILPKSLGTISTSTLSPKFNSLLIFLASSKLISNASSFALSITSFIAYTCVAPVCSSIFTSTFSNASKFLLYAVINAVLIDSKSSSFLIPFSFSNSSKAIINSLLSIAFIFYTIPFFFLF